MSEAKKHASDYNFPEITVGVYIFNKKGEMFLIRSPKWHDKLIPCGGHIDFNESVADAAVREVKEETGLDVANPEIFTALDFINSEEFHKNGRHFIALQCKADLIDDTQAPVLDGKEAKEGVWIKPEDAVGREDMEPATRKVVGIFLLKQKKGLFSTKKCKECEKNKTEAEEYKSGWQRALADYKNLQKETTARMGEWAQMSERQILEEFIPVYDNFKKAFAHHPELKADNEEHKQMKNWTDGIGYIMKQFGEVLKTHSVEEIKTMGEKFDPKFHEAAGEEAVEGKEPGIILKEVDAGYKIEERVIKAAKVIISR